MTEKSVGADKRDTRAERQARKQERIKSKKARAEQKKKDAEIKNAERKRAEEERQKIRAAKQKRRAALYVQIRKKLKNIPCGFDYENYGLLPRTELSVAGDRTSVAALFASNGIKISDMTVSGEKTVFKIRRKDLRKGIAILDEMCYNYQIGDTYGIGRTVFFIAARCGLVLGGIAAVACMYISYGYIWRVRITGNVALSEAAVSSALTASGIKRGVKKRDGLISDASRALVDIPGVADAACEISGTTLYVRILESTEHVVREKPRVLVSGFDATVTRVVMRGGTAAVKKGDAVRRGQVLATGDVYSTAGELMYSGYCDADIYGNIAVTYSSELPATRVEYRRTGKVKTVNEFTLFGRKLGRVKPPFGSYEFATHTANYDVLVPLYVTTYVFYETAPVEIENDVESLATEFAKSKISEFEFSGDFDYSYTVTQTVPGLHSVHLFLSGEALISRGAETLPEQEK